MRRRSVLLPVEDRALARYEEVRRCAVARVHMMTLLGSSSMPSHWIKVAVLRFSSQHNQKKTACGWWTVSRVVLALAHVSRLHMARCLYLDPLPKYVCRVDHSWNCCPTTFDAECILGHIAQEHMTRWLFLDPLFTTYGAVLNLGHSVQAHMTTRLFLEPLPDNI